MRSYLQWLYELLLWYPVVPSQWCSSGITLLIDMAEVIFHILDALSVES